MNDWSPANFEQVLEQRAIDAAIRCIDRSAEYAKHNKVFPSRQGKMRRLAYALRERSASFRHPGGGR